jgi:hypothetical protein
MDNIYLKIFLEHHYRKNPVYISNNEIEEFLMTNREAPSQLGGWLPNSIFLVIIQFQKSQTSGLLIDYY